MNEKQKHLEPQRRRESETKTKYKTDEDRWTLLYMVAI